MTNSIDDLHGMSLQDLKNAIANGADPRQNNDDILVQLMSKEHSDNFIKLQYLMETCGCRLNTENMAALMLCFLNRDIASFEYLLKHGGDVHQDIKYNNGIDQGSTIHAVMRIYGCPNMDDRFFDLCLESLKDPASDNQKLLTYVFEQSPALWNTDILQKLIAKGCDFNAHNGDYFFFQSIDLYERWINNKPLFQEVMQIMMAYGARPFANTANLMDDLLEHAGVDYATAIYDILFNLTEEDLVSKDIDIEAVKNLPTDNLLDIDANGYRPIDYLGARNKLSDIFNAARFKGAVHQAEKIYGHIYPQHKKQVEIDDLLVNIIHQQKTSIPALKRRRKP